MAKTVNCFGFFIYGLLPKLPYLCIYIGIVLKIMQYLILFFIPNGYFHCLTFTLSDFVCAFGYNLLPVLLCAGLPEEGCFSQSQEFVP